MGVNRITPLSHIFTSMQVSCREIHAFSGAFRHLHASASAAMAAFYSST
jgi:hypothetical protein